MDSIKTLNELAILYHTRLPHGKISITPKSCTNNELPLAYTPGVGHVCLEIQKDPAKAYQLTNKGNLVAVMSNGTAVLGLGDIGALASKPVMEGKALLFKLLAGVDAIDVCINETNVDKMEEIIRAASVSFGAINLEDIKAPECFDLLARLQNMDIPVFHDDQDGTAVVVAAALLNSLKLVGKNLSEINIVCSGAGAAMIATLRLLECFGVKPEQITMFDSKGVIHQSRTDLSQYKQRYAVSDRINSSDHSQNTMSEAMSHADVFIGLSSAGVIKQEYVKNMRKDPILLCLANPVPEITPELIKEVRDDAIICTGSSRYPNQVNNAICFPFLFRAALDARLSAITQDILIYFVEILIDIQKNVLAKDSIMPNLLDQSLPYIIVPYLLKKIATKNSVDNMNRYELSMHEHHENIKNTANAVNRYNLYTHKYPHGMWNDILVQSPIVSIKSNEIWLQDACELFSATDAKTTLQIQLVKTLPENAETYIFQGQQSNLYTVGKNIGLPTKNIDLKIANELNTCLAAINGDICYIIDKDYATVTFIVAVISRCNIEC